MNEVSVGIKSKACINVVGVFGSGKSFLLSVMVMFIVNLLEMDTSPTGVCHSVLISSLTNVAVDRILIGFVTFLFTCQEPLVFFSNYV